MSKTSDSIAARPWVKHVDDERSIGNGVIVTLQEGWEFVLDPGCGVRGFDTLREARDGTMQADVRKKAP